MLSARKIVAIHILL